MNRILPILVLSLGTVGFACGGPDKVTPPKAPPRVTFDRPPADTAKPAPKDPAVNLSPEIRDLCKIEESDQAPKFDFDASELSSAEKEVLAQVAKCLTTGALKGRKVQLVGRADPRGEQEYNMTLGHKRAVSVRTYLGGLGVESARMSETSRGELDSTGSDEDGWRKDRRVDVKLLP